jgi:hypothetical protein
MSAEKPEVDRSRRNWAAGLGALGGALVLAACSGEDEPEDISDPADPVTGSGLSGTLTLAAVVSANANQCLLSQTLSKAQLAALGGRVWVALEPYSSNCEVVAVTGASLSSSGSRTVLGGLTPTIARQHLRGAPVAILESGVVTPQLFGFAAGMADATPFLQAAIDAVAAKRLGGGTVYLPRGTYPIQTGITINEQVNLVGDGAATTLLAIPTTPGGGLSPTPTITWTPAMAGKPLDAILCDFQLQPAYEMVSVGIQLVGAIRCRLRRVWAFTPFEGKGFGPAAFALSGRCMNVDITSCVADTAQNGILIVGSTPATTSINIRYSSITANHWGINVSGPPSQVNIEGNDLEGNSDGSVTGSFLASTIRGNYGELADNSFLNIGGTVLGGDPSVPGVVQGLEVSNNYITLAGGAAEYAIQVLPSGGGSGVSIRNNRIAVPQTALAAIRIAGLRNSEVRDNYAVTNAQEQTVACADYVRSNDVGLKVETYRFLWPVGATSPQATTETPYAGNVYALPFASQVLGLNAYYTGTLPAGATFSASVAMNGTPLPQPSISAATASPASSMTNSLLGRGSLFAPLTNLGVTCSASGVTGGAFVVEVLVGFGTPGGGFT